MLDLTNRVSVKPQGGKQWLSCGVGWNAVYSVTHKYGSLDGDTSQTSNDLFVSFTIIFVFNFKIFFRMIVLILILFQTSEGQ